MARTPGFLAYGKRQAQQQQSTGGTRAVLFVYAMEALENMAFIANAVSLVTYFFNYMNFGLTKSATTVTNFLGTSFLLALFGGFISDTYLSRFQTCLVFGSIELVGYTMLTMQAQFRSLRPEPCRRVMTSQCKSATGGREVMLYAGLYLVAFGTGGVKAALPALGADQFDEKNPKELPLLSSFFNWFLFSLTVGASLGVTFLVWISSNLGWNWSFGISTVSVLLGLVFLSMGRAFYRTNVPGRSPIIRILQVLVAAARNRRHPPPKPTDDLHEINAAGKQLRRSSQFRFLDRAAIISGDPSPWHTCTVAQVEEAKILLRMLPIILSTVFMNVCLAQLQTFSVHQATTMNTHLFGGFHIPPSSLPIIPLFVIALLLPVYDRAFVPLARRLTGVPTGISHLHRIAVGLLLSAASMAAAAMAEARRRMSGGAGMRVFWLGWQYGIFGAADMFSLVGLLEFFYEEAAAEMKTVATAAAWCSVAFGYFESSVVVQVVNKVSSGWLASNDLDRDRLDLFYWLLAGISLVNFAVYLGCASWYKSKEAAAAAAEAEDEEIVGVKVIVQE